MQDPKIAKNSPSAYHRTTLSGYIFATKARIGNWTKLLNINISSTCPHNMMTFGSQTAEICWRVWDTPANFNGFRILASLLQRCRSTEANQILHDVAVSWTDTLYIHFRGLLCRNGILPKICKNYSKIHFASKSCVLLYWQRYCTAPEQWASAKVCGVVGYKEWS